MSSGVTIAQLQAQIGVDADPFMTGLTNAEAAMNSFGTTVIEVFTRIEESVSSGLEKSMGIVKSFSEQVVTSLQAVQAEASGVQESLANLAAEATGARAALEALGSAAGASLSGLEKTAAGAASSLERISPAASSAEGALAGLTGSAATLNELKAAGQGVGRSLRSMGAAAEGSTSAVKALFESVATGASSATTAAESAATAVKGVGTAAKESAETGAVGFGAMTTKLFGIGMAASMVGGMMESAGHRIVGTLTEAVERGNDYQLTLQQVAANTTMTAGETRMMEQSINDLGAHSAAPLKDLATAWMHAANNGLAAREIPKVLEAAAKSAVATGGDVSKTTDMLTSVLHNFHLNAQTDSVRTMAILHEAAIQGNQTLEEFVAGSTKARASSAMYKQSLVDTAAALATMTRAGWTASTAATTFAGMMENIIKPTKQAQDMIDFLSEKTGVKLKQDFTVAGAEARGFIGILDDLKTAARISGQSIEELYTKLFTGQRGRRMAGALLGNNAGDLQQILGAVEAQASGTGPNRIEADYQRAMSEANNQLKELQNNLTLLAGDVSSIVMPALMPIVKWADDTAQWFRGLSPTVKEVALGFAGFAGVMLTVGGSVLSFVGSIATVAAMLKIAAAATATATVAAEGAGVAAAGFGAVLSGPVVLGVVAAVAAIGGLAYWYHQVSDANVKSYAQMQQSAQANAEHAQATLHNAETVERLVGQIDDLRKVAHPTTEQAGHLRDMLDRLSVLSPDLVTGYDHQGHALGLMADAFDRASSSARTFANDARIASAQGAALHAQDLAQQRSELQDRLDHLRAQHGMQHTQAYGTDPLRPSTYTNLRPDTSQEAARDAAQIRSYKSQIADLTRQMPSALGDVRNHLHPMLGPPTPEAHDSGKKTGDAFGSGLDDGLKAWKDAHKHHLDELQKQAEETAKATKDALRDIFDMQHEGDDAAMKRRDARDQLAEDMAGGVPKGVRDQRYNLRMSAAAEAKKAVDEAGKTLGSSIVDTFKQAADAAGNFYQKEEELADKTRDFLVETNQVNLADYLDYLKAKESGMAVDSAAYIDTELKIRDVTKQITDAAKASEEASRRAGSAFGEAMSRQAKAVEAEQKKQADLFKFEFDHQEISYEQYRDFLEKKLALLTPFTDAYRKMSDEIGALDKSVFDKSIAVFAKWDEQWREGMAKAQEPIKKLADSMVEVFANALGKAHLTFANFFGSVELGFEQMVLNMARTWLENQMSKIFQSGLNGLIGMLGNIFTPQGAFAGPGGIGFNGDAAATMAPGGGMFSGALPAMAGGGDMDSGRAYLVGEMGPELVVPRSSGRVINNADLQDALAGDSGNRGGTSSTVIHVHVHGVTDKNSFRSSETQIGNRIAMQIELAKRRNGG